jgi:hypothetical protein
MREMPKQDHINKIMNTWQGIDDLMKERGISPQALANATGYPKDHIEGGRRGEPEPLTSHFLHACINVFGLKSARAKFFEETDDVLSDDECMTLLRRPSAISHRQGSLWDD